MRVLQVLGAILILGGLFVLIKSPSYSSEKSVLKIGDVEAKVSQEPVSYTHLDVYKRQR